MKRIVSLRSPRPRAAGTKRAAGPRTGWGAILLALCVGAAPATAAVHTVIIDGMRFVPETIEVKAGDTVVWRNKDPFPHTVASIGPGFASVAIAPQGEWRFEADNPGRYAYLCTLHRTMRGVLVVKRKERACQHRACPN